MTEIKAKTKKVTIKRTDGKTVVLENDSRFVLLSRGDNCTHYYRHCGDIDLIKLYLALQGEIEEILKDVPEELKQALCSLKS